MMNISSKTILWICLFVVGVGLIIFSSVFRDSQKRVSVSPTPAGAALTFSPVPSRSQMPSAKTPMPTTKMGPAACQISGSIHFIDKNLYETKDAKIVYQNIDDSARLVFWKIMPDDGSLKIGPNIFSGLPIPNGEHSVGVTPTKTLTSGLYTLTASVSYGVTDSREVERIYSAACAGSITVTIPFK